MRIDAHQHFWRYAAPEFPWIDRSMQALARDHLPADLAPLLQQQRIDATVAVQARPAVAETDWLLSLAAEVPWIAGVVGWADLQAPDVGERIGAWHARGPLVGLRAMVQDAPDPAALMADAAFNRGVAAVQSHGLAYDLLVTSAQLDAALAFCRRHDRHWIVLDHCGKPDIRGGDWPAWSQRLQALAALPHVVCKLSGLATQADWAHWRDRDVVRHGRLALDAFGAERVLHGSDWPVCTLAAGYGEVTALTHSVLAGASAAEQAAVFGGTAARCYGIAPAVAA